RASQKNINRLRSTKLHTLQWPSAKGFAYAESCSPTQRISQAASGESFQKGNQPKLTQTGPARNSLSSVGSTSRKNVLGAIAFAKNDRPGKLTPIAPVAAPCYRRSAAPEFPCNPGSRHKDCRAACWAARQGADRSEYDRRPCRQAGSGDCWDRAGRRRTSWNRT